MEAYLQEILNASDDELRARFPEQERPKTAQLGAFHWPWDMVKRGAEHMGQHQEASNSLTKSGYAVASSPNGSGIVAAIGSAPTNSANTDQVMNNGLFTDALNSVKADRLLRTMFVGSAGGAQVGLFGGGGGSGVAYDVLSPSDRAGVGYSSFNLGAGAQAGGGLLVGAMVRQPRQLNTSTQVWSFGAALVGLGASVSVLMDSDNLDLVGFTLNLGGGFGASSSIGWGSIWLT